MSAAKTITVYLGKNKVKFEVVPHKTVFTAYDLAQTLGAKLDDIAKTLLVKVEIPVLKKKEKRMYLVVLPASYRVDLDKVKKLLKATDIGFVKEQAMKKLGIEPGALSPFGMARGFGVVLDKALLKTKDVIVGAESFTESLRMKIKDYVKLEKPVVGSFGKKSDLKLQKKSAAKKKVSKKKAPAKKKKPAARKKR